ncbi:hypothetical protein [Glaciecola sp. KUL10]|uniref:hypothetical protein n=1 Tax=Glaciecola sp. (strain KUL10) TaxID=2161813 RepID=UPI000D789EA2|nr:hypothetical protein [Glaciecola sp. KUL10]GBL05897.1 periplasmic protease [Glaciecola sp. KUL10]
MIFLNRILPSSLVALSAFFTSESGGNGSSTNRPESVAPPMDNPTFTKITDGVIGYVEILSMGGISDESYEDDAAASEALMDRRVLADLAHTDARMRFEVSAP